MALTRHTAITLQRQVGLRGPTWCDSLLRTSIPARLAALFPTSPFQQELQAQLRQRTATLTELGLATPTPQGTMLVKSLDQKLRELARQDAGHRLEAKLGDYATVKPGMRFEGVVAGVTGIAGQTHAVVRSGVRFTLAPMAEREGNAQRYVGRAVTVDLNRAGTPTWAEAGRQKEGLAARIRIVGMDLYAQRNLGLGL